RKHDGILLNLAKSVVDYRSAINSVALSGLSLGRNTVFMG
ncbi:Os12g0225700, partial [Oryza sativa Japonica Group]